jgi:hypothetical protein
MTRSQRKDRVQGIIEHYADEFRRELARDIGFDIRKRIDREKDGFYRGCMLAAEKEVYREMRVAHGDCPGGPLDESEIEVMEHKGNCFEKYWGAK